MALALASAAWGQQKEPAKPEAAKPEAANPEAANPEAAKTEPPKAQKKAALAKRSKRQQDARHCLQRGDNTAIIKCAEEYL